MAGSAFLIASAASFPAVLAGFILGLPASGAFVSLSQAALMDMNPGREPQMMARWSVAGTLGNLIGPLLLAGGFALGLGWRWAYLALALAGLALAGLLLSRPIPIHPAREAISGSALSIARDLLRGLGANLRNLPLLRWILLAITADLLMDVFTSYLPLYFTDVVGFTAAQASLVLSAYILFGLINNFALIPILERFPGRRVVRLSAAVCIPLYAAWLLVPWPAAKVALALAIALALMGWYALIDGEIFAAGNGRSGTVMAIGSLATFLGGFLFWLVGWTANTLGLQTAMWLLILGPVSILLGVPKAGK
jgi:FSR family fosmidomycin resistance protein-like MFS transporter